MIVPGIASTPTHASDVPSASLIGRRIHPVNAGTMSSPPPMPRRPESPPAPTPMSALPPPRHACGADADELGARTRVGHALDRQVDGSLRLRRGHGASRYALNAMSAAVRSMSGWPSPGTTSTSSAPPDRGERPRRRPSTRRRGRSTSSSRAVAQRTADRAGDDRRERRGDGGDRCRTERTDRRRRDDRAADAEHPRQHAGPEPDDRREDDDPRSDICPARYPSTSWRAP